MFERNAAVRVMQNLFLCREEGDTRKGTGLLWLNPGVIKPTDSNTEVRNAFQPNINHNVTIHGTTVLSEGKWSQFRLQMPRFFFYFFFHCTRNYYFLWHTNAHRRVNCNISHRESYREACCVFDRRVLKHYPSRRMLQRRRLAKMEFKFGYFWFTNSNFMRQKWRKRRWLAECVLDVNRWSSGFTPSHGETSRNRLGMANFISFWNEEKERFGFAGTNCEYVRWQDYNL